LRQTITWVFFICK